MVDELTKEEIEERINQLILYNPKLANAKREVLEDIATGKRPVKEKSFDNTTAG